MHSRSLRAALATAALLLPAVSGTIAAAPATAAPAAADPEYAGYSSEWFTGTLATASAAGTYALGSDVVAPTEVVGIDLDADGRGYAIDFTPHRLLRVGIGEAPVVIGGLTHLGLPSDCRGLDYSGGVLYASCRNNGTGDPYMLATVDPTNATLTLVTELPVETAAIALDPLSGDWWLFAHAGGLYIYDGTTVNHVTSTLRIWGADFDATGRLWATPESPGASLNGRTVITIVPDQTAGHWFESLTVRTLPAVAPPPAAEPEPTLAETGADTSWQLTIAAVVALLAGITAVFAARARRRVAAC
ncbi:hypothetical protein H4J02_04985 [Protaetiibacter sp. SSC-01]|uniref:hypothetical protein n=1 Tax=Protaetiibacter sp. SSC-01 TaxID=2759943 RepID=UPI001656ADF9|nr:hypothetical protein [Protaetiibacter sp. SSC-01]QNO38372.1 hypothetical protein H4J02_04985 [Protaetiibacter sp. SSC-01]